MRLTSLLSLATTAAGVPAGSQHADPEIELEAR